jgi:transcriptional regulator with XRE-family HTH domain
MSDKINLDDFVLMKPDYAYIAEIREQNGLTQQQLSDVLKMPLEKYQQYESGKINMNVRVLQRILDAFDMLTANK